MTQWAAFGVAFGTVFLAELGDKTQLGVMLLATRMRRRGPLFVAAASALALNAALAVALGGSLGQLVAPETLRTVGGALFVAFGVWFALDALGGEPEAEPEPLPSGGGRMMASVFTTVFVAEMGDKTQLATGVLAVSNPWLGTALGASAALVASTALAVLVGRTLGRFPPRVRRGVVLLVALTFIGLGAAALLRPLA